MTDFKSAAEQQVRETLEKMPLAGIPTSELAAVKEEAMMAYNALVSKTAELMEMTAQRDEAQKALEIIEASLCACPRKQDCNCHACFSKRTAAEALRGKQ